MTVLSLIARQDYLEKVARTRDPIKANSEFVWNALDADATRISVEFGLNVLGGIEEIVVRDNGIGISRAHAERDFGNLGDSRKRTPHRTPKLQRALHGKESRGRLRFQRPESARRSARRRGLQCGSGISVRRGWKDRLR